MPDAPAPSVPQAWVTAGLAAAIAYHKRQRDAYWNCPSSQEVTAIIAAVMPLAAEAERARIRTAVSGVIAAFLAHYGQGQGRADDLAEAVRQVLDREPMETQERSDEKEADRD